MKKFIVFAMVAVTLTIFNGCQKDELNVSQPADEVQPQNVVKPDVYAENGYLAFKNIEAVDSVLRMLSKMTTEEKLVWEKTYNVVSARSEFDKLFKEYEQLNSYEEFLSFKNKHAAKLTFNEMDEKDCSIGYPYVTDYFISVLNNNGLVKIGESLIKYTKSEHIVIKNGNINALDNLAENVKKGDVFVYPKLRLKSTYNEDDLIHDFPEDNPFPPFYYTPWHQKTDSRRLKNELRINRYRYYEYNYQTYQYEWVRGYNVYFKQQAQKKSWGSWRDYATTYTFDDLAVKVGSEPIYEYNPYTPPVSPEVKPHAIIGLYWYVYRMPGDENNVPPLLSTPSVSVSILTSCRGFDGELYRVDNIEHSGFPGSGIPYDPVPGY